MLIAIDGNEANIKKRVGSNVYAHELLKEFSKARKKNLKFKVYLKEKPLSDLPKETDRWQYEVLKAGFLWTQWRLPGRLFKEKEKPAVFFSPGHYAPSLCPVPLVVSILDVSYLRFPSQFRFQDLWQLRFLTQQSARKAEKILTISQASKNDIMEYYRVPSDKVRVIYPGIRQGSAIKVAKMQNKIKDLKAKYQIKGDYVIYVGTLQPRKNLLRLIEAFEKVQPSELKLVIAGKKGWLYKEIFSKVEELNLGDRVIFTGFVPDEELPYLIKGSICLVLVSLYEGFGLPVAEAMSLGVPVVTSNISSLPEVAGKAGILVNPHKVEEITKGIEQVVSLYHQNSEKYQELASKSQEQAKKFSWEKCAQEVLKVLEEVAVDVS